MAGPAEQQQEAGRVVQSDARSLDSALISLFRSHLDQITRCLLLESPDYSYTGGGWWQRILQNELLLDCVPPLAYFSSQIFTGIYLF
jgi:hypothetical protein